MTVHFPLKMRFDGFHALIGHNQYMVSKLAIHGLVSSNHFRSRIRDRAFEFLGYDIRCIQHRNVVLQVGTLLDIFLVGSCKLITRATGGIKTGDNECFTVTLIRS